MTENINNKFYKGRVNRSLKTEKLISTKMFKMLFDNNPALMAISKFDTLNFIDVNATFIDRLGYSKEEIIGKSRQQLGLYVDKLQLERITELLHRFGRVKQEEVQVRCKNGEVIHGLFSGETIVQGNEQYLLTFMSDITDLKHAEEELEHEKRLFSSGPVFTIIWSPEENWPVLYVSDNIEAILGYTAEEMKSKTFKYAELIHPNDLESVYNEVSNFITLGFTEFEQSYRLRRKDGEYRWFYDFTMIQRNEFGQVESIRGYMFDQTYQKNIETSLALSRSKFENILKGTNAGTWEWNIPTGETEFNERWANIIGYTLEELSPISIETWIKYSHPDDLAESNRLLKLHFAGELDYYECEGRMKHKNGEWVWVLDRGKVSKWSDDGKPLIMYGTHQDINRQKRIESELRESEATLKQAKELAESASLMKNRFLANMSHEIRTPMNGIMGYLELLSRTNPTTDQKELINDAKSASEMLLFLINDILDFSKIEAGKLVIDHTNFGLRTALYDAVSTLVPKAMEKKLSLNIDIHPDVPDEVYGDPTRLKQVIGNLLSNAVKFTEHGDVQISVNCLKNENRHARIHFEVTDTGIGIAEENLQYLFKPFSQADASTTRKFGGTGLGLAISKELVSLMGGELTVSSILNKGTTFGFSLEVDLLDESVQDSIVLPKSGCRILLVKNVHSDFSLIQGYLEDDGCLIDVVHTADEALKRLIEKHNSINHYKLTLIDYDLVNPNGFQLAARLKSLPATQQTKLILLSSMTEKEDESRAKHYGFDSLLNISADEDELLKCLQVVLGKQEASALSCYDSTQIETQTRQKLSILLVEDNEMNQKIILKMLNLRHYDCDVAYNGKEACDAVVRKNYDIILMDCQMPILDGYEATRQIREIETKGHHSIIIALTANAMKGDKEKCFAVGMDDYLSKPIDFEKFFEKLDTYSMLFMDKVNSIKLVDSYKDMFRRETGLSEKDAQEFYHEFFEKLPEHFSSIKTFLQEKNALQIKRIAHNLIGSSGNLRVLSVQTLAKSMEQAASNEDYALMGKLLSDMETALCQLK